MRPLITRLIALFQRRRLDRELADEISAHLEMAIADGVARGMSPEEARRAAMTAFGGVLQTEEAYRDRQGFPLLESMWQDVRYAARSIRRSPAFAAIAVLTLALGIGATTSIFSVVHTLLIRPLPFPDADRLVAVFATSPTARRDTTSFLDFSDWQHQAHTLSGMAAYRSERFNITGDGTPEPVRGLRASHELLTVLGVSPAIGRAFDRQEQHAASAVALIGHGLWTRRYGSDPHVLGKTILVNEVSHVVIGVLPPGFEFPPYVPGDLIVPVPERPSRSTGYIRGIARLNGGTPLSVAQQELDTIARGLEAAFPNSNRGRGVNLVPLREFASGDVRVALLVLLGAAFLVLLIGCANVGNLVLAKGLARQRELAVRRALGAGRGRLVRQLLTESLSLALIASVLGLVGAFWGSAFLVASLSQRFPLPSSAFSWTLLLVPIALASVAGMLSGLPPALILWRSGLNDALKQDGRNQSAGMHEQRLGNLLIVGETALTVMLLIGAGLLMKSFVRLQQVDLGVNPRQSVTANLVLSKRYLDPERREMFVRRLLESVAGVPGVQEVAVHTDPPFLGGGARETFTVEGLADPEPGRGHAAGFDVVSGRFFSAMGIPIAGGRDFEEQDTANAPAVAIINETMARRIWPGVDPIGKRLRLYYDKSQQHWLSIVGIVRDVRYRGRLSDPIPQVFVPSQQYPYKLLPYVQAPLVALVVRTASKPAAMIPAIQAAVWAADKDQPVWNFQPMDQVLWEAAAEPRVYMTLLGIFAAIALVIASAGIYGLSAYAVVRRRQELGIRLALGATPGQILALVLGRGMFLNIVGAALGLAGALGLAKVVAGFLYGITATDAPTFLAVLLLFAAVAFVATYVPARRAATIDPSLAFRAE
jgi:putative ABC transport system permease protein